MATITVHDKNFEPYLTSEEIHSRIKFIAHQLNTDYVEKRPLFIAILNGSFILCGGSF
jgi:hypoxanthine phosphoribosyltransferase